MYCVFTGNISSLSGSDSDSDSDTDSGAGKRENKPKLVPGMASQLRNSAYSSTDSESDAGSQVGYLEIHRYSIYREPGA